MYRIIVKKKAQKFIEKLPKQEKLRIVSEIQRLPNGEDIKPLNGHKGLYRLRIGNYRFIYTVDHGQLIVFVIDVDNRGDVYKRL